MGIRGGNSNVRLIFRLVLVLIAASLFVRRAGFFRSAPDPPAAGAPETSVAISTVPEAFAQRRSNVFVDAAGVVERVLSDDLEGIRHQRFIVRLESGLTVLVAHNIGVAPRVPVSKGVQMQVRGEYEWNEQGGVIHWTHHDPEGRRPGGRIRIDGKDYR